MATPPALRSALKPIGPYKNIATAGRVIHPRRLNQDSNAHYQYDIHRVTRIGMVNMLERKPEKLQMSVQGYLLALSERQENPHISGQASADPKTSLYVGIASFPYILKEHKYKLKVKRNKTY